MAFVGVEFSGGGEVAIISNKWLTPKKKHSFWPNYTNQYEYNKSLQRGELPLKDEWEQFEIARIFFETDEYSTARKKIKLAEELSDVSLTDYEETVYGKSKRKRVAPRRLYDDKESDESSIEEDNNIPRPPRISFEDREVSSPQCSVKGKLLTPSGRSSHVSSPATLVETPRQTPSPFNLATGNRTLTDETIINLFSTIKEQNKQILAWIKRQSNPLPQINPDLPFVIPITNSAELMAIEAQLKEKDVCNILITRLKTIGGKDVTSQTNNIMRQLMTNDLATQFSFFGSRKEKRAFSDLCLKTAVVRAVQCSSSGTAVTDEQIHNAIKTWLKHAPQRLQAEKNVNKRKTANAVVL